MKKILTALTLTLGLINAINAQQKKLRPTDNFAEFSGAIGSSQGSVALGYVHNWKYGKHARLELGLGLKFTSYFGRNLYFKTAPAKLTSGKSDPTVLFTDDIEEHIDSVLFPQAQINPVLCAGTPELNSEVKNFSYFNLLLIF